MAGVGTAYVSVRVDTSKFEGDLERMLTRLSTKMNTAGDRLGKDMVKGLKGADWDSGFKGLSDAADKASKNAVRSLDRVDTRMNVLGRNTDRVTQTMTNNIDVVTDALGDARQAAGDLSSELTSAGRAGKRINIGGIGGGGGGGGSLRKAGDDAGFFRSQLNNLAGEAASSTAILTRLFNLNAFGGTAIAGLVGGLSGAAQGLFALGANAAAALPALSALSTGLIGLGQVGATVGIAMHGVGDAISAGFKLATDTATPAAAAAKKLSTVSKDGIKAAQDAVQAARENLRAARLNRDGIIAAQEAVADAVRGIVDAKDALRDAYRDAGWAASDAARRTIRAEQQLAAAQGATLAAQEALNEARAEALEQLEDIGFQAEDAALAEQRADIALQEAYARLVEVSELSPDNRARQEAELAFKEAELQLRQAKDAREDADAAQQQAATTGVEGTQAMQDAHADLQTAQEDEAQAAQDLADAQREQGRTTIENAEAINDAEQALADARAERRDALRDVITAEQEHAEAVRDAADALKDAQGGLRDARADYAAARAALADQNAELAKTTPAFDAYAAALEKLSPQQRLFVERLVAMRDTFADARKQIADPLFKGLNQALTDITQGGLFDLVVDGLTGTSEALGNVVANTDKGMDSFGELAKSPVFQDSLREIMESNNTSIKNFGGAAVNLADAFVQVADAASPLLEDFSKWVEQVTKGWSETTRLQNSTGELTNKFQTAADRVKEFWDLGKELWETLKKLGGAANTAANEFEWFTDEGKAKKGFIPMLTNSMSDFNDGLKNKDLVAGFDQGLQTLAAAGRAVKNSLIDPFITMGQDKGMERAFTILGNKKTSDAMGTLAENAGNAVPKLAKIVSNVLDLVAAMSESGAVEHFLDILEQVSEWAADFAGVLSKTRWEWLNDAITGVSDAISEFLDFIGLDTLSDWFDKIDAGGKSLLQLTGYITGAYAAYKILKQLFVITTSPFAKLATGAADFAKTLKSDGLKSAVKGIFSKKDKVAGPGDEAAAKQDGTDITEAFAKGIRAGMKYKDAAMAALRANVKTELTKVGTTQAVTAAKVGNDIMEGLERGIVTGKTEAVVKATDAGRDVARAVGKGAGTMSPSVITMKDGNDVMEGLEVGINSGLAEAKLTATKAGASVGHAVGNSAKGAAATSTAGIGAGIGGGIAGDMDKTAGATGGRMAGAFSKMLTPLKAVGRGFGGLMTLAMGPFGIALELIILLLPILIPLFKKLEEKTGIFSKTLGFLTDSFKWLWDKIKELFGWVMDNWPLLLGILTGPIGLAVTQIIQHWDEIKAAVDSAVTFVKNLLGNIWDGITAGWDKITAFFGDLWPVHIKPWIDNLIAQAGALLTGLWDGIKTGWWKLVAWSDILEDWVKTKIQNLFDKARDVLKNFWEIIKTKWQELKNWAGGLWGSISGKINDLITSAGGVLKDIWDRIKTAWTNLGTFFSGLWGDIRAYIGPGEGSLIDKAGNALENIWNKIQGAWNTILRWAGRLWDDPEYGIKTKIDALKSAIAGPLEGIWDGIKTGFAKAWNWVSDNIDKYLIANLNKVLDFFGAPQIKFDMPRMDVPGQAEGGWVRGPGGPKDDRVLRRLSNKEYVLPAKSAAKLGPQTLEYMRRYGELPTGQGGIGSWFKAGWEKIKDVADAVKDGAEAAVKWALSKATAALGENNGVVPSMARGLIGTLANKIVAWGKKKDQEAAAASAAGNYTGPPGAWINPLGSKAFYTITTMPGVSGHTGPDYNAVDLATYGHIHRPIYAVSAGKVTLVSGTGNYGNHIVIDHGGGVSSLYAHMDAPARVRVGAIVKPGTWIGNVGTTGNSTGEHLHFELDPFANSYLAMLARGVRLAAGGVVAPSARGTMALLAEAGRAERVTPLDREGFSPAERKMIELLETRVAAGGSGDTYNIQPSTPVNEAQLADLVSRRVSWNRRRGARV